MMQYLSKYHLVNYIFCVFVLKKLKCQLDKFNKKIPICKNGMHNLDKNNVLKCKTKPLENTEFVAFFAFTQLCDSM